MHSMRLHQLGRLVAVVVLVRCAIGVPTFGQHQDVLAEAERVRVHSDRPEVDVRVVAGGLARGGTVKVPYRELVGLVLLFLFGEGL